MGEFGACTYADVCALTGIKTRTDRICENGAIVDIEIESADGCERSAEDTNGMVVASGEFGACAYAAVCALTGIKTRTDRICENGAIVDAEIESADGCERAAEETNGTVVDSGEFGACTHADVCALSGTKTRTDRICENGVIVDAEVESTEGCERSAAETNDQECGFGLMCLSGVCGAVCGDGFVAGAEECDDGALNGEGFCSVDCQIQGSGDCNSVCDPLGTIDLVSWTGEGPLGRNEMTLRDAFGWRVAQSETHAIVTAPSSSAGGAGRGSVFVYDKSGLEDWTSIELAASDGAAGDQYGFSVGIDDDLLIVGAYLDDAAAVDSGSAYLYEYDDQSAWREIKLTASHPGFDDQFGIAVDVSGNTAVVGVHFDDDHGTNSGSVYVFEKQANEEWTEVQKLTASDAQPWDLFGGSVAIDGDRLVIGAIGDESRGAARESVYIFERSANGEWLEVDVFNASSGQSTDAFGTSVAVCGDHVFVGAPGAMSDGLASGAAYMYSHSEGNLWTETKVMPRQPIADQRFGAIVSCTHSLFGVGSPHDGTTSGSAYVYRHTNTFPWEEHRVTPDEGGAVTLWVGLVV